MARRLRTNPKWVSRYRWVAQTAAPILFIAAAAYLALSVVNLSAFNIASTLGTFCRDSAQSGGPPQEFLDGIKEVDIKSRCHPTGLTVIAGRQYRIRLETDDWFDKSIPVDVAGFSSAGFGHMLFAPLKRSWQEKWFQPMVRVGRLGNYEYPLKPAAPLAAANFAACEPASPPFWTGLGKAIAGFADRVRDIPNPASTQTMESQLACERTNNIRRVKVLISDFTPTHSGELFIHVNDAVLALPGLTDMFYRNNTGTAKVTVQRIVAPEIIWQGAAPAQKN